MKKTGFMHGLFVFPAVGIPSVMLDERDDFSYNFIWQSDEVVKISTGLKRRTMHVVPLCRDVIPR